MSQNIRKPRMLKPMVIMLFGVILLILILAGTKYYKITQAMAANSHRGPPPQAVTTMIVEKSDWNDTIDVVGALAPSQGVTLAAEEEGTVVKIGFESGSPVKVGEVLVQLDTSVEEAQLQSAEARLELARTNLKRVQLLYKQSAVSESALNTAVSEEKGAVGDVKAIQGVIARKTITAPFDGRVGIRMVNIGQYLNKGTQIVPLHQLNPIFLDFALPQKDISLIAVNQSVEFTVDGYGDTIFKGNVTAIDTQIDSTTRNINIQATVNNEDERLKPGMFASIKIILGETTSVMAVPSTSINYAPYGNSVYVVENVKSPDGSEFEGVRQQFVQTGQSKGDLVAITKGLNEGDEIVTSGVFKLRPGFPIIRNNSIAPGSDLTPSPENT